MIDNTTNINIAGYDESEETHPWTSPVAGNKMVAQGVKGEAILL